MKHVNQIAAVFGLIGLAALVFKEFTLYGVSGFELFLAFAFISIAGYLEDINQRQAKILEELREKPVDR